MKADVLRRLQRAGRYDEARIRYIRNAQRSYGFSENPPALDAFKASMDSSILVNTWRAAKALNTNAVLFKLGDTDFKLDEFAFHVERSQRAYRDQDIAAKIDRLYQQYVEDNTVEYALGRKDEAFRRLLQEYRDGILLFELTEEKVWQQAMRDTLGLQNFYEQTSNNYLWGERVEAIVYTIQDAKSAKKVRKSLQGGASSEAISAKYNSDEGETVVSSERGLYLPGQNSFVDEAGRTVGLSADLKNESGNTVLVQILRLVPSEPKTLDEAKGYVISDYQEFLEDRWVEELRAKYPVVIHQQTFQSMIR
jgi:peptidyl-prolyl cis-trans isomerase SurA